MAETSTATKEICPNCLKVHLKSENCKCEEKENNELINSIPCDI